MRRNPTPTRGRPPSPAPHDKYAAAARGLKTRQKEQVEKIKWQDTQLNLRHRRQLIEREVQNHIYNPRSDDLRRDTLELEEFERTAAKERETEQREILLFLSKASKKMAVIKSLIARSQTSSQRSSGDNEEQRNIYIERLRSMMELMDKDLLTFKETAKLRYELLASEEKLVSKELSLFEAQLEHYEDKSLPQSQQPIAAQTAKEDTENKEPLSPASTSNTSNASALPIEVTELEDFIAENGGITGGWNSDDHAHFLKLRTQLHKTNFELFVTRVAREVPNQNFYSVQRHEQFYVRYLQLVQRKKEAIKKWKAQKELARQRLHAEEFTEIQNERQTEEERIRELEADSKLKEEKRRQLQAWKEAKAKKQAELEAQEKARQEEEARQREAERMKREAVKEQLVEFQRMKQERKKAMESESELQDNSSSKPQVSEESLQRLRERDQRLIYERMLRKEIKEREEEEKNERLRRLAMKVHVHVPRDFSRVIQPTKASESRETEIIAQQLTGSDDPVKSNFNIIRVQHKARPAWRADS